VGHEEVIVTLTRSPSREAPSQAIDAVVVAEAGRVAGRSEQTIDTNRAVRRVFFIVHLVVGSRNQSSG
jgi:hypothetical protein